MPRRRSDEDLRPRTADHRRLHEELADDDGREGPVDGEGRPVAAVSEEAAVHWDGRHWERRR